MCTERMSNYVKNKRKGKPEMSNAKHSNNQKMFKT